MTTYAFLLLMSLLSQGADSIVPTSASQPVESEAARAAEDSSAFPPPPCSLVRKQWHAFLGDLSAEELEALADMRRDRIVPAFRAGRAIGFKLFSIGPGSLAGRLGFAGGDVVLTISDLEMNNPNAALSLYENLNVADRWSVLLLRHHDLMCITVFDGSSSVVQSSLPVPATRARLP